MARFLWYMAQSPKAFLVLIVHFDLLKWKQALELNLLNPGVPRQCYP